ncbi:MAG: hypothetical protein ACO2O6_00955 [Candidatus Hydrothermia bacterium]|jgi:hypothetical protein
MNLEQALKWLEIYDQEVEKLAKNIEVGAKELGLEIANFSLVIGAGLIADSIRKHNEIIKRAKIRGYITSYEVAQLYQNKEIMKYGYGITLGGIIANFLINAIGSIISYFLNSSKRKKISEFISNEIRKYDQEIKPLLNEIREILYNQINNISPIVFKLGNSSDLDNFKNFERAFLNLEKLIENYLKTFYIENIYESLKKFNHSNVEESLKSTIQNLSYIKYRFYSNVIQEWLEFIDNLISRTDYQHPFYEKGIKNAILYILLNEEAILPKKVKVRSLENIKNKMFLDSIKDIFLTKTISYFNKIGYKPPFLKKLKFTIYSLYLLVISIFLILTYLLFRLFV